MKQLKTLFFVVLSLLTFQAQAFEHLKLSTTTSTENSGLLNVLHPAFEQKFNVKIDVIAVGTGKALKIGSRGDVDVVFVHAPAAELKYVEKGDFIDRQPVMHNDFVVVGPDSDPASLSQASSATQALTKIANTQSRFVSRGDDSGTHKKELALWDKANIEPHGEWYLKIGQGMGAALKMADEKRAYTLTDRGTQLAYSEKLDLEVKFEGDEALFNPYHVMAVNPAKQPHVNYQLAQKYIDFITGEQGQKIIADYKIKDQQLFYPDVIK